MLSVSPSRLDGSDLLQDLHEMADCADRIDSILDGPGEGGAQLEDGRQAWPQRDVGMDDVDEQLD